MIRVFIEQPRFEFLNRKAQFWRRSRSENNKIVRIEFSLHMRHHLRPARSQKSRNQKSSYGKKDYVQDSRVIECDGSLDNLSRAVLRDEPETLEKKFDHQGRAQHRNIKNT